MFSNMYVQGCRGCLCLIRGQPRTFRVHDAHVALPNRHTVAAPLCALDEDETRLILQAIGSQPVFAEGEVGLGVVFGIQAVSSAVPAEHIGPLNYLLERGTWWPEL